MEKTSTVREIIDRWPVRAALAEDVGEKVATVHKWAQTGSIPARRHAAVLRSAVARGISLTAEELAQAHDEPVQGVAAE